MLTIALTIALILLGLALALNMYRLLSGPSLPDRILALDTLCINAIGLLLVLDMQTGRELYFEAALLIAALGFISTVALAKYRLRGALIE